LLSSDGKANVKKNFEYDADMKPSRGLLAFVKILKPILN
jgi:hypothetical protein